MRRMIGGKSRRGQSLLEMILILPLIFLLIVNTVNFGAFFYAWITVANAARAGAEYMIRGGSSLGLPALAHFTDVQTLVQQDTVSLPNSASIVVATCANNQSASPAQQTITMVDPTACVANLADPEPTNYVLAQVTVTYTYLPLIPLWEFPGLRIHATLPPTTIRRTAYMRMM